MYRQKDKDKDYDADQDKDKDKDEKIQCRLQGRCNDICASRPDSHHRHGWHSCSCSEDAIRLEIDGLLCVQCVRVCDGVTLCTVVCVMVCLWKVHVHVREE